MGLTGAFLLAGPTSNSNGVDAVRERHAEGNALVKIGGIPVWSSRRYPSKDTLATDGVGPRWIPGRDGPRRTASGSYGLSNLYRRGVAQHAGQHDRLAAQSAGHRARQRHAQYGPRWQTSPTHRRLSLHASLSLVPRSQSELYRSSRPHASIVSKSRSINRVPMSRL